MGTEMSMVIGILNISINSITIIQRSMDMGISTSISTTGLAQLRLLQMLTLLIVGNGIATVEIALGVQVGPGRRMGTGVAPVVDDTRTVKAKTMARESMWMRRW